jgi:hypothetical protein
MTAFTVTRSTWKIKNKMNDGKGCPQTATFFISQQLSAIACMACIYLRSLREKESCHH